MPIRAKAFTSHDLMCDWLIDCLLLTPIEQYFSYIQDDWLIDWLVFNANFIHGDKKLTICKGYIEMRKGWTNWIDFWLPLEKYGELGRDGNFSHCRGYIAHTLFRNLPKRFLKYRKCGTPTRYRQCSGADPWFQVRGGGGAHLKKLRRTEGGANIFGVFRVKNHNFTPKNHIPLMFYG